MKKGNQIPFPRENGWKNQQKTVLDKNHEGYYSTQYRPNLKLKSGKPIFFSKKKKYT